MALESGLEGRFFYWIENFLQAGIIFHMPTPFYHLSLAEDLLKHPALPEEISHFLHDSRCVFLFGNTSPDVQVISGQPRQSTHFFNLPIQAEDLPAWELLLLDHPHLADPEHIPATQAIFIAGYLCHLQADWLWVKDIFAPFFGPQCSWDTFSERLYLHNVLRAYLDERILPGLHTAMHLCLSQVEPDGWLPFVKDFYLCKWRDFLFPQLEPGATSQTVEVFSSRQGVSSPEIHALLASEERMQAEVFEHLPLQRVLSYHQRVLDENSQLLSNYLAFTLHPIHTSFEGNAFKGVQT
jgi:hypothetical protein